MSQKNYDVVIKNDKEFSTYSNSPGKLVGVTNQVEKLECKMGPFFIYEISDSNK